MTHPGLPTTYRMQGQKRVIMKPFEIRYEHLVFKLEPGVPTEVPLFIYELFQDQQELAAKRDVLKSTLANGTQHYGKAIAADPSVDPNYEDQINQSVNQKGIASLQGV